MENDYEVLKLGNEEELLQALNITNLAGSDVPDCSSGVILIRFKKSSPATADDVSAVLKKEWPGDKPLVLSSTSGFTPDAFDSVSEYEDAHLFAPSA